MPRQLSLGFRDDCPADSPPQEKAEHPVHETVDRVQAVAEQLRPRVMAFMRQANRPVGIHELRAEFGHAVLDMEPDPQANPVNRLLKQLRDQGEVVCNEPEWGEPTFMLAQPLVEAAAIKGNEAAKRGVLIAAAWGGAVRLDGPDDEVAQFRQLADSMGVEVQDDDGSPGFTIHVTSPSRRERETSLPGTSTKDLQTPLVGMTRPVPTDFANEAESMLAAAIRDLSLEERVQQIIRSVAGAIARLDQADEINAAHIAEAINYHPTQNRTRSPSEETSPVAAPPLLRPDRQFTFDGLPHYEWPQPEEDRDTITVDRLRDDIDGPAHRFVIRRGDTVEVFFRRDKLEIGEVVGISLANREVRVSFREGTGGIWFAVGQIYPAVEAQVAIGETAPLSQLGDQASRAPEGGFSEQDRVPDSRDSQSPEGMGSLEPQQRPFTLADYRAFLEQLDAGDLDIAQLQAEFRRLVATHEDCVATLQKEKDATQLKALAWRLGCSTLR